MKLKEIPIGQLKISRSNMRHGGKAPDVSDILPSIRENGVQQSMLVRKEGKGIRRCGRAKAFICAPYYCQGNRQKTKSPVRYFGRW